MFRRHRLRRFLFLLVSIAFLNLTNVSVSSSSEDARDVVKRGTIEVGLAAGYWQATTAVGDALSANRSGVFIMPRVGMVLTDALGSG